MGSTRLDRRHLALPVLSILLAGMLCLPASALGAEPIAEKTDDGGIVYTYRYLSTEKAPTAKKAVTVSGNDYELDATTDAVVDASYAPGSRDYTYTETKDVAIGDYGDYRALFAESHTVEDGEYVGTIPVTDFLAVPVYDSYTRQVDRQTVVTGLPTNDVNQLPTTQEFEVTSDAGVDATTMATLRRADVVFAVDTVNANGMPTSYKATITWRGEESYLSLNHYSVTATYAGPVTSNVVQYTSTASYRPVVADEQVTEEEPEPFNFLPIGIGTAAAVVVAAAIVFASRRRLAIVEAGERGRVLARVRVRKDASGLVATLPPALDLVNTPCFGRLAKSLQKPGLNIRVIQSETIVYDGPATETLTFTTEGGAL